MSRSNTGWLGAVDPARREAFERAMNVSNVGSVLMQQYINRVVQQLTLREFGAWATMDHRAGSGLACYINRRAAGATGGEWVVDTAVPTEETGTYSQVSFNYKTAVTRGKITRKAQAVGATYGDILAGEIAAKAEDMAALLEGTIINGDSSVTAAEIDGLLTQIGNVSGQTVGNTTAAAGDDLTLVKLDQAIDRVKGSGSRSDCIILGSFAGLRKVNAALQADQQFNDVTEIAAGFRVRTYDGIPMVTSTGVNDSYVWNGTDDRITAFTGGTTTALFVINKRYTWIEELTPMTVMPLAKDSSQYDQFDMFTDLVVPLANTSGAAILGGLSL